MNSLHRIKNTAISHQSVIQVLPRQVSWLNIGLVILVLSLLLYYVIQTNLLAAQTWQMRQLQDQLTILLEQRNSLIAQQSVFYDRAVLQDLAQKQGLVPAGAVVYLVQDTAVAAAMYH